MRKDGGGDDFSAQGFSLKSNTINTMMFLKVPVESEMLVVVNNRALG